VLNASPAHAATTTVTVSGEAASGLGLDAYGAGTTNGTPIMVWGCKQRQ
jgi:hypothetical protein